MTTKETFENRMKIFNLIKREGIDPVKFCTKQCREPNPNDSCDECLRHMIKEIGDRNGNRRSKRIS